MFIEAVEQAMTDGWKDLMPLLAREYRNGFECGYCGRYMELKPRMSDAYSQGYAQGYELAQMQDASSVAHQQGYEDVTYEEMAKGDNK